MMGKLSWPVCRKQCQWIWKRSIFLDFKVGVQLSLAGFASVIPGLYIKLLGSAADTNFKQT